MAQVNNTVPIIPTKKPSSRAPRGSPGSTWLAGHDADAQCDQRAKLRPDDHRPDDQDWLVNQDTDAGDQHGHHHEGQVADRQPGLLPRVLLKLLPDEGVCALAWSVSFSTFGSRRQDDVEALNHNGAIARQTQAREAGR
jgi:hypothetical protein